MLLLVWCVSGGGGFSKCKVLVSSLYVAALFFQYSSFPFSFVIFSRLGSLWRFWTAFPGRFSNYILTDTPKTHQIAHINYASARIMDWRLVFFMISGPPHPPPSSSAVLSMWSFLFPPSLLCLISPFPASHLRRPAILSVSVSGSSPRRYIPVLLVLLVLFPSPLSWPPLHLLVVFIVTAGS